MLSQIQPLKSPEKVNSWGTHFQTTCSLIHSLWQHGSAAWSRAVRATSPPWAPPRKGKLPCNGLACLAVIWCHHCPRDEVRAAQLCGTSFLYSADNGTSPLPPGLGALAEGGCFTFLLAGMCVDAKWTQGTGAHQQHYNGNAMQRIKSSQCPMNNL